jgi:para-nitrobenzyl esterase
MASTRPERVETAAGPVVGFTGDGVVRWRSIPYARPPVGALRLRAPQPAVPWRQPRYCDTFGFAAPQRRLFAFSGLGKLQPIGEDCLTLNVIAPATPSDEPLPVMFFIHGGGWIAGTSAVYDGAPLARRGCVFVSANYRLGALGCLDLSSLSTPEAPIDSNLYLRDLVLALQWVQDNIRAFGGDPTRVTVFGESAGAHTTATLMAVPQAQGLFSAAIVESTGFMRLSAHPAETAEQLAGLLGASRCDGALALKQAEPARLLAATDQLMSAVMRERPGTFPLAPSIDGDVLPCDPVEAMAQGRAHPIPLVIGSNADEGTLVARVLGHVPTPLRFAMPLTESGIETMLAGTEATLRTAILSAYPGFPAPEVCGRMWQDRILTEAVWRIADAHGRHHPTYVYRHDYAPRPLHWLGLGATHGVELLAVFDAYRSRSGRLITLAGDWRSAARLSDDMQLRWVSFATRAVPGAGWPVYTEPDRAVMVFDRTSRVEYDPDAGRRLAWRGYRPHTPAALAEST